MKNWLLLLTSLLFNVIVVSGQNELIPRFSTSGDTLLELNHRWTKMGDENGIFDTPTNDVSVENGQFSHDETRIATVAKGDNTVRLFRASDGELLWVSDGGQETECLAFTADDRYIVTGGEANPEINIWEASSGTRLRHLAAVGTSVEGMAFSPDFQLLACGNEGGRVLIYDTSDPNPINWSATPMRVLIHGADVDVTGIASDGHSDVNQVEWTNDGELLLAAGRNGIVTVWQVADFENEFVSPLRRLRAGSRGSLKSLDLSIEGDLVASCNNWRTGNGQDVPVRVVVHEIATGDIVFDYAIPGARVPENVTFDPSGQIMLSGCDFLGQEEDQAKTFIWRTDAVRRGETTPSQVIDWFEQEYFDFSDAADQLIVSGNDGSVRVFDVKVDTSSLMTSTIVKLGVSSLQLEVHPNPTSSRFFVYPKGFVSNQHIKFSLYDLQGQLLQSRLVSGSVQYATFDVNVSGSVVLIGQQGRRQVRKILVVSSEH